MFYRTVHFFNMAYIYLNIFDTLASIWHIWIYMYSVVLEEYTGEMKM